MGPQNLFVVHQTGFAQLCFVEVNGGDGAAQQPSGGITHGDGNDLVPDMTHYKQIYLTEQYEGGKHDDHRSFAVDSLRHLVAHGTFAAGLGARRRVALPLNDGCSVGSVYSISYSGSAC